MYVHTRFVFADLVEVVGDLIMDGRRVGDPLNFESLGYLDYSLSLGRSTMTKKLNFQNVDHDSGFCPLDRQFYNFVKSR